MLTNDCCAQTLGVGPGRTFGWFLRHRFIQLYRSCGLHASGTHLHGHGGS